MRTLFLFLISACQILPAYAGITMGATRVIYDQAKKETTLEVISSRDSVPYLIQAWVETSNKNDSETPFIITPPLFKLLPGNTNLIRIVSINKGLPTDRESLFSLNVRAIPAMEKQENAGRLLVTTQSVLKLIYRPAALSAEKANEAYKNLSASAAGSQITLNNPTPYVINIGELKVNGTPVKVTGAILPFSHKTINGGTASPKKLLIKSINDYGGTTKALDLTL